MRNNALTNVKKELREVASDYAIRRAITQALREHAPDLEDELRAQLSEGRMPGSRGREKAIVPKYRNAQYEKKKHRMNPRPGLGTPDLKLSGELHKSLKARVKSSSVSFEITDTDSRKVEQVEKRWGDAFQLSKERWHAFNREVVGPELRRIILSKIR